MKRALGRLSELAHSFALPRLAPWRNAPFALFVVGILAYGAALAWYTLHRFDLVNLIREGYWDDAFYYFQIAYHMAEGRFSTFDGGLTRTNGYHPLWLFLLTPFYWLFDKTEALFAVKAFEIMLLAGGAALVAVAARVARLPWILLFAVLPTLCAQGGMLWGMEAALVLFILGLLLLAMCLFARHPARWKWPLAALAFALPWARLELAAVAAAATAALCLIEWSGRLSGSEEALADRPASSLGGSDRRSLRRFDLLRLQAAVPLAGALAGVLVYFVYNGVVFGGVMPVSGAVKADVRTPRLWEEEGGYALAKSFEAYVRSEAFDNELLIALEVCVYALLAWWLSGRARNREDTLLLVFVAGVFGLAAGHLAMFAQCVAFLHPWQTMSLLWEWYFVPAHLMEALVVPLRCCMGIYLVRRLVGPRLPRTSDVLRLAAIVATTVVLAAKVDFAKPFRFVDMAQGDLIGFDVRSYMGTVVLNRLLPEDTLVGSWDSGVVGYFSRSPVMNLDGLVNSYDYKRALESEALAFGHLDEPPRGGVSTRSGGGMASSTSPTCTVKVVQGNGRRRACCFEGRKPHAGSGGSSRSSAATPSGPSGPRRRQTSPPGSASAWRRIWSFRPTALDSSWKAGPCRHSPGTARPTRTTWRSGPSAAPSGRSAVGRRWRTTCAAARSCCRMGIPPPCACGARPRRRRSSFGRRPPGDSGRFTHTGDIQPSVAAASGSDPRRGGRSAAPRRPANARPRSSPCRRRRGRK